MKKKRKTVNRHRSIRHRNPRSMSIQHVIRESYSPSVPNGPHRLPFCIGIEACLPNMVLYFRVLVKRVRYTLGPPPCVHPQKRKVLHRHKQPSPFYNLVMAFVRKTHGTGYDEISFQAQQCFTNAIPYFGGKHRLPEWIGSKVTQQVFVIGKEASPLECGCGVLFGKFIHRIERKASLIGRFSVGPPPQWSNI